jgi:2-oxo-4-hydroxy-4-carboxy-5-ureidoimidazoline decarboxylase
MPEPHAVLNALDRDGAAAALRRACGAEAWVQRVLSHRPFESTEELLRIAEAEWNAASRDEYLEAFSHHPRIGEDIGALRERFRSTASLSLREQAGVTEADEQTLLALRAGNARYRERFGYIFIICATGKTARQMLDALERRQENDPEQELLTAAREQGKILRLRLEGLGS